MDNRALTLKEWKQIEDGTDAFSLVIPKFHKKQKRYYQFLLSDAVWIYDADDYDTVLEVWQVLGCDGELEL